MFSLSPQNELWKYEIEISSIGGKVFALSTDKMKSFNFIKSNFLYRSFI